MPTMVDGEYRNGVVLLSGTPPGGFEGRVTVIFPETEYLDSSPFEGQMRFGQFAGLITPTEEDFKTAEWHGGFDEG